MASRRTSVSSTNTARQRKYSTDRHQRQAELSLRIEERRLIRPPLVKEDEVTTSFLEDFFTKPRTENVTSLTRADTGRSPLEIHPGDRVRGYSTSHRRFTAKSIGGQFFKPFAEPNADQEQEIEQRYADFKAKREVQFLDAEAAQPQIQRVASDAQNSQNGFWRRAYSVLRRRRAIKPGAFSGLQYAASFATSHAHAVASHTQDLLEQRRALYVLEYEIDADGIVSAAPPQLFQQVAELKEYLEKPNSTSILRLIYTCNSEEAVNYLSGTFGISNSSTEVGERSFRDWMQDDRDTRRASNKAIRWRPAFDIARSTLCCAFGIDFGSIVVPPDTDTAAARGPRRPPTDPSANDQKRAFLSESVYKQRVSVYMQRVSTAAIPGPRVTRFNTGLRNLHDHTKSNTIIICEYSAGEIGDIINTPSLLALDLPIRSPDVSDASSSAIEAVMMHMVEGLLQLWRSQITLVHEPHAELEDFIYSQPSDSSHARDVWAMSKRLHNMLKLVNRHAKVIEAVQDDFKAFAERKEEQTWLDSALDDFHQLGENLRLDYLQPLEHMIDLMYKSVTIRDSRQSLELNASLWRLSWITFIFLPLTFLVGAFGMNVDVLEHYPSIKWYFIAVVPLFFGVLLFWFIFRKFIPKSQRAYMDEDPRSRLSILQRLFDEKSP